MAQLNFLLILSFLSQLIRSTLWSIIVVRTLSILKETEDATLNIRKELS